MLLDFYADWCAPCKKLDAETFSDPRVIRTSDKVRYIKVDCTVSNDRNETLMEHFSVVGVPTLVFIRARGQEVEGLKTIGFIDADRLLQKINILLQGK